MVRERKKRDVQPGVLALGYVNIMTPFPLFFSNSSNVVLLPSSSCTEPPKPDRVIVSPTLGTPLLLALDDEEEACAVLGGAAAVDSCVGAVVVSDDSAPVESEGLEVVVVAPVSCPEAASPLPAAFVVGSRSVCFSDVAAFFIARLVLEGVAAGGGGSLRLRSSIV